MGEDQPAHGLHFLAVRPQAFFLRIWDQHDDPVLDELNQLAIAVRRRIRVDRDLPMKAAYRTLVDKIAALPVDRDGAKIRFCGR